MEEREILKIARKVLGGKSFRRLKRVRDRDERMRAAEYAVVAGIEREFFRLEKEIKRLEEDMKDVFFAKNKLLFLPGKIKLSRIFFDEKEIKKMHSLLEEIKEEINNVQSFEFVQKKKGRRRRFRERRKFWRGGRV